jgi:hypothetical protein
LPFQIHALNAGEFQRFFDMDAHELAANNAEIHTVQEYPGFPCRISLADIPVGERALLVNYTHQGKASPYHASHAIFVGESSKTAQPEQDEIPAVIASRLISVRGFNARDRIVGADVVDGADLRDILNEMLSDKDVDYIHLHNAKQGCFAAKVTRV